MRINIRTVLPFLILIFLLLGTIGSFVVTVASTSVTPSQNTPGDLSPHRILRNLRWLQWWITVMWR